VSNCANIAIQADYDQCFFRGETLPLTLSFVVTDDGIEIITKFPTDRIMGCGMNY
jgi:hypothetical protein